MTPELQPAEYPSDYPENITQKACIYTLRIKVCMHISN